MSKVLGREPADTRHRLVRAGVAYLIASLVGHLTWELLQIPLYTLWRTGNLSEIAFAILHCTIGDLIIAGVTLLAAIAVTAAWDWPQRRFLAAAGLAVVMGVVYTAYSEWLNVYVRQSWSYEPAMPVLRIRGYGIGLAPLAQWLVVPIVAFRVVAAKFRRN